MTLYDLHTEIAKERFLELMAAEPNSEAAGHAVQAIEHADVFIRAYQAIGPQSVPASKPVPKKKGCPACFGSGGKVGAPCKACKGTGKVSA